ncbi:GntR family transcriptional regulator [Kitasatospora sp. NPDC092948]|uniref:GntR family transcriptional regulator n=1 Tax=Kitasatospora sp. NPDC092948 TaxID=3364088 RepID=UPI00380AE7F8
MPHTKHPAGDEQPGDDAADQPDYERIAADLAARIEAGEFPPGSRLPSLAAMEEHYGTSLTTVRNAVAVLRHKGLVETGNRRAGTMVAPQRRTHRLLWDRYSRPSAEQSTPFTADTATPWEDYRLSKRFEVVPADAELAEHFGVEAGELLLARHFVFHDSDGPEQMSTSYVLWSMVQGTPVADPANEPWPGGTRAQLKSLGVRVAEVYEWAVSRMPTEDEKRGLALGPGVPVLSITRRMQTAEGRVVEVGRPIVRRGPTTVIEYRVELQEDE